MQRLRQEDEARITVHAVVQENISEMLWLL